MFHSWSLSLNHKWIRGSKTAQKQSWVDCFQGLTAGVQPQSRICKNSFLGRDPHQIISLCLHDLPWNRKLSYPRHIHFAITESTLPFHFLVSQSPKEKVDCRSHDVHNSNKNNAYNGREVQAESHATESLIASSEFCSASGARVQLFGCFWMQELSAFLPDRCKLCRRGC